MKYPGKKIGTGTYDGENTLNNMKRLSILLLLSGLSGAWDTNFKITNKFSGDGSEKYPASEKD